MWLIRIFKLRIHGFGLSNVLIGFVALIWCGVNVVQLHDQQLPSTSNKVLTVRVYPDSLKVDHNYVTCQGTLVNHHEKVLIHGVVSSKSRLKAIRMNRTNFWRIDCRVSSIDRPTNTNQFNANQYYKSVGITNSLSINRVIAVYPANRFNFVNWIHSFRQRLLVHANRLPAALKTYTLSLILGETDQETSPELRGVKQLGLIHLFSISGFHVYYLVGILEFILVHLRVKRERYRKFLFAFLPTYYIFAGASIGLLRSILMVEIGLLCKSFRYRTSALDVWSLALVANLIMEPRSLVQFGCQLSYVLSFALIYTRRFSFWKQTIFMNLVSFPFIIFNIYNWHLLTIAANLLILPLFSIIVFPVVIIGAVGDHFLDIIGQFAATLIGYFDRILNGISNLPGNIYFGKPQGWIVIVAFIITLRLISHPDWRTVGILISLYLVTFMVIHYPLSGEVSYFDVGQGDSFLVRTPFNRSVTIIDTGGKINFGSYSPSNYQALRTSINYLSSRGIHTVDNLCLSHQDADHCGDVPAFLQNLRVKRLLIPEGMDHNQRFMNRIRPDLKRTKLIPVKNDDVIPEAPLMAVHPFSKGLGTNSDSMVLFGQFGGKRWLFMGDLDQKGELDIIHHYPTLKADVLKLGHHGSSTATGAAFLNQIDPQIAIVSAGRHNRYHHPDPDVVKRVKKRGIRIFNTQTDGMITYRFRGQIGNWSIN